MSQAENIIPVEKAQGATPKEIPDFMVSSWGSYLTPFIVAGGNFSQSITNTSEVNTNTDSLDFNVHLHYAIPLGVLNFISNKVEALDIRYVPENNEILIQQCEEYLNESPTIKQIKIKIGREGFMSEVIFSEEFIAPNLDGANRTVRITFDSYGATEFVTDEREIISIYDYLPSGLEPDPDCEVVIEGRYATRSITYQWNRDYESPLITAAVDEEMSRIVLKPKGIVSKVNDNLLRGKDKGTKYSMTHPALVTDDLDYPANYISEVLPPDYSLAPLIE